MQASQVLVPEDLTILDKDLRMYSQQVMSRIERTVITVPAYSFDGNAQSFDNWETAVRRYLIAFGKQYLTKFARSNVLPREQFPLATRDEIERVFIDILNCVVLQCIDDSVQKDVELAIENGRNALLDLRRMFGQYTWDSAFEMWGDDVPRTPAEELKHLRKVFDIILENPTTPEDRERFVALAFIQRMRIRFPKFYRKIVDHERDNTNCTQWIVKYELTLRIPAVSSSLTDGSAEWMSTKEVVLGVRDQRELKRGGRGNFAGRGRSRGWLRGLRRGRQSGSNYYQNDRASVRD